MGSDASGRAGPGGGWPSQARPGPTAEAAPDQGIDVVRDIWAPDATGERRRGVVVRLPAWDPAAAPSLDRLQAHFRIVILERPSPPLGPLPRCTVVCIPAQPAAPPRRVAEPAAAYGRSPAAFDSDLLARGRLEAACEIGVTAAQAFAGGEQRFELLGRELLYAQDLADTIDYLALALAAPSPPRTSDRLQVQEGMRELLGRSQKAGLGPGGEPPEAAQSAFERISELANESDARAFLLCASRLYEPRTALLDDVYLLRALAERPAQAFAVLDMQSALAAAVLPPGGSDLTVDHAIVAEQLRFASLVPEPQRLDTAKMAFEHFWTRYRKAYAAHHTAYWQETAKLHSRLQAVTGYARALARLNSLLELGPPTGEATLAEYEDLLSRSAACELPPDPGESAFCPGCRVRLGEPPPREAAEETLDRIQRALQRQMARLSSVAVRQILERSGDARVERFLKVVQATQISSLADIMDDEMVGYLRRFLVEARIGAVLEPIFAGLQQGVVPDDQEAREALVEMAHVIQRAFRGAQRSLPPALPTGRQARPQKRRTEGSRRGAPGGGSDIG
ncbi:MAG: hypothetical protein Q7T33_04165 [Dehalococcoidia bacterium]|nr:hypothetical protein [Dehalococcoidia bacterium]